MLLTNWLHCKNLTRGLPCVGAEGTNAPVKFWIPSEGRIVKGEVGMKITIFAAIEIDPGHTTDLRCSNKRYFI